MKLTDLKTGDIACIKSIYCNNSLRIHLMEMGLINNTKIKVLRIISDLITISFRNTTLTITKDIGAAIEINRICR